MEVALRRRLEGVADLSISQSQQTTVVTFAPGHAFSAAEFRRALREAEVDVLRMEIELCGAIEQTAGERSIAIAGVRFVLRGHAAAGGIVCVTGQLGDQADPDVIDVMKAEPAGSAAR
jgi:hypothetical protein